MAETHQSTNTADKSEALKRDAEQAGGAKTKPQIEGEPRSFKESSRENGAAQAARTAGQTAGDIAQRSAETVRQVAETSRNTSREVAQTWRASLEPLVAMQMDLNRWMDESFRQFAGFSLLPYRAASPLAAMSPAHLFGLPATDIKETDQAYVLSVELAGLSREDVELSINGDALTISGHKTEEHEEGGGAYRMCERRYGRFERSFPIPPDVERQAISAAFRDGVLKVTLPRAAEAGSHRSKIAIKAN